MCLVRAAATSKRINRFANHLLRVVFLAAAANPEKEPRLTRTSPAEHACAPQE